MLGGIAGDVIGSAYEFHPVKTTSFALFPDGANFTDDTVMSMATATVLLDGGDYAVAYRDFGYRYPRRGYGSMFHRWLHVSDMGPYQSFGNGAAMRAGPIGLARDTIDQVLEEAERSASVSHDHPEGIKGAQAAALGVFLARAKVSKEEIRREISVRFQYDLARTVEVIRPGYAFNESCQETVPEAIICFLDSRDYEECIRLAVSLGGDADTLATIAGAMAGAWYGGVPETIAAPTRAMLPGEFLEIIDRFDTRFSR